MVNKVELKRGNLDYEIRKLKGLNDYLSICQRKIIKNVRNLIYV